uniref:Uncharacterized protein n=1 Tax=Arundo donax TaxID=35708 RepID=A0A0A9FFV4_ARUDO
MTFSSTPKTKLINLHTYIDAQTTYKHLALIHS